MIATFFDTETTGFVQEKQPDDSPSQAHLVQLAMIMMDTKTREPVKKASVLVDVKVPIPESAFKSHGITNEKAARFGIQPKTAAALFKHFLDRSDRMVAHNKEFDKKMMSVECARHLGLFDIMGDKDVFCTMEGSKFLVNCPPSEKMIKAGMKGPKSPRLAECYRHFYGEELVGAHDALVDTEACMRVYFTLLDGGHITE